MPKKKPPFTEKDFKKLKKRKFKFYKEKLGFPDKLAKEGARHFIQVLRRENGS